MINRNFDRSVVGTRSVKGQGDYSTKPRSENHRLTVERKQKTATEKKTTKNKGRYCSKSELCNNYYQMVVSKPGWFAGKKGKEQNRITDIKIRLKFVVDAHEDL